MDPKLLELYDVGEPGDEIRVILRRMSWVAESTGCHLARGSRPIHGHLTRQLLDREFCRSAPVGDTRAGR